jgi:serine/threonine protein kinase
LRLISDDPKLLTVARTLFQREAATLEKLGKHDRIPQLFAYFEEENEFYLVQEFISGHPLSTELRMGIPLPEIKVVTILRELLEILDFVHGENVIHRDIKPSNIIRRKSDDRLVLIDFGAVKAMQTITEEAQLTSATIGIGTKGFMPSEQYAGNPRFSSDLYAVGITGIQAITGLPPTHLKEELRTGEIIWRDRAVVSQALADVLSKMVRYDFNQRYQSAKEALQALEAVSTVSTTTVPPTETMPTDLPASASEAFLDASTQLWPQSFFQQDSLEQQQYNAIEPNDEGSSREDFGVAELDMNEEREQDVHSSLDQM